MAQTMIDVYPNKITFLFTPYNKMHFLNGVEIRYVLSTLYLN